MAQNKKISKCFMNGRSCSYERAIHEAEKSKTGNEGNERKFFVIMPFEPKLSALYKWQIAPFLESGAGCTDKEWRILERASGCTDKEFKFTAERADEVRQLGYIICEKICKKIQEADYITVELSFDNANVFYELGISVALEKKILPLCLEDNAKIRRVQLKKIGINRTMIYCKFNNIEKKISDYLLPLNEYQDHDFSDGKSVLILHHNNVSNKVNNSSVDRFDYSFGSLYKNAVEYAISEVFSDDNLNIHNDLKRHKDYIGEIKDIQEINLRNTSFSTVINAFKKAACVLIDISENINTNYFWLGYLHGVGANVIPINRIKIDDKNTIQGSVPFDIRALWHIVVNENNPIDLGSSLTHILTSIYNKQAKDLNRKKFWGNILESTAVSIFLGSHFNKKINRNTVTDWDYLTAAEISTYLSSLKETIKVTLESPLPKSDTDIPDVNSLENILKDKNCIILASADVNDLTEYALCRIYNQNPFEELPKSKFKGYIAYKEYNPPQPNFSTAFYRVEETTKVTKRGFEVRDSDGSETTIIAKPYSYNSKEPDVTIQKLYGQLVVAKNPVSEGKWLIIISGISGPATLGIAQMLTGVVHQEHTVNTISENGVDTYYKMENVCINAHLNKENYEVKVEYDVEDNCLQYEALSEKLIKKINEKAGKNGETNTLVDVNVFCDKKKKKIVSWNFTDIKHNKIKWNNPNHLMKQESQSKYK